MPDPTVGLSHWFQQDPAARDQIVIAAWQSKGSARRFLAGIGDERLRDIIRDLTPAEVSEIAGSDDANPFLLAAAPPRAAAEVSGYVSALEAENRSLRKERKQLADALAAEMLENPR